MVFAAGVMRIDEKEAFTRGYGVSPEELERRARALKALNVVNYARSSSVRRLPATTRRSPGTACD